MMLQQTDFCAQCVIALDARIDVRVTKIHAVICCLHSAAYLEISGVNTDSVFEGPSGLALPCCKHGVDTRTFHCADCGGDPR